MPSLSKEEIELALKEHPNMLDTVRCYYQAIINGKLPEYYRQELVHYRDDYSDELPNVDVRTLPQASGARTHAYMCQTNVMIGICQTLRGAVEDDVVTDPKTKRRVDRFLKSDLDFQVGDPKNKSRINKVNRIINDVIDKLG